MNRLSALAVSIALVVPSAAIAQPVDPGFSKGPGSHPIANILLFPLYLGARIQASMSPEKASCWSDGAKDVAFCNYAERADEFVDNRPTPYGE